MQILTLRCCSLETRILNCEVDSKFSLEVCVPQFDLNKTRQDDTGGHFPNWRDRDNTTVFWSRCSENQGMPLSTTRESPEPYRILISTWAYVKLTSHTILDEESVDF